MIFTDLRNSETKSIWTETSAAWDETHPSWKTVGKTPLRMAKERYPPSETPVPVELRRLSLEHVLGCDKQYYRLAFTSGRRALGVSANAIPSGTHVIVEADRGEDCALITETCCPPSSTGGDRPTTVEATAILRVATAQDVEQLRARQRQEARALEKCLVLVRERDYPMEITRCEFQWDMKKITFYFRSNKRIDFRDLVKELFKYFKIRIWMSMENRNSI